MSSYLASGKGRAVYKHQLVLGGAFATFPREQVERLCREKLSTCPKDGIKIDLIAAPGSFMSSWTHAIPGRAGMPEPTPEDRWIPAQEARRCWKRSLLRYMLRKIRSLRVTLLAKRAIRHEPIGP